MLQSIHIVVEGGLNSVPENAMPTHGSWVSVYFLTFKYAFTGSKMLKSSASH